MPVLSPPKGRDITGVPLSNIVYFFLGQEDIAGQGDMSLNGDGQRKKMNKGTLVIVVLGVLTAVEFVAAVGMDTGLFAALTIIALAKTWLILDYFMHLTGLWAGEE